MEKPKICELCRREAPRITRHHLVPRARLKKNRRRRTGGATDPDIAWLCRTCHKMIHAALTEKELESDYRTTERLRQHPDIRRYLEWVHKHPDVGHLPVRRTRKPDRKEQDQALRKARRNIVKHWVLLALGAGLVPSFAGDPSNHQAVDSTVLHLRFTGLISDRGPLRVDLYGTPSNFKNRKNPLRSATLPVREGQAEWRVEGLSPGTYAAVAYHDENKNEKLDRNPLRIPIEPMGFSNNARSRAGPPDFEQVGFEVSETMTLHSITMYKALGRGGKWGVGAGLIYSTTVYKGDPTRVIPIPFISYVGERLALTGPRAAYNLSGRKTLDWGLLAKVRFEGYEEDDSDIFEGMDDRDFTLDAGLYLNRDFPADISLAMTLVTDTLNKHNGQEVTLFVSKSFSVNQWTLRPGLGVTWQSSRLVDYYYGVDRSDATDFRPAYRAGSSFRLETGLRTSYRPKDNWVFLGGVTLNLHDEEIQDSPLVDEDFEYSLLLGVNYLFQ